MRPLSVLRFSNVDNATNSNPSSRICDHTHLTIPDFNPPVPHPQRGDIKTMSECVEIARSVARQRENLHFLERDSVEIGGVLFLGATLWTMVPEEHWSTLAGKSTFKCLCSTATELPDGTVEVETLHPEVTTQVQWRGDLFPQVACTCSTHSGD